MPKPQKAKPGYHHGDLKNALVQAAVRLIAERRDTSFTMRELAAAAGVSHAAAYRHFQAKRDILAVVAAAGFSELKAALDQAVAGAPGDVSKQLAEQGRAYVRFAVTNPGHFRAMFHADLGDGTTYPELATVSDSAFASLLALVTRGAESGVFVKRPPLDLAVMAWATVHGLGMLALDGRLGPPDSATSDALARVLNELMLNGFLPRENRTKTRN